MIDYEKIDSATGQNWFDIDPVLQATITRGCPAEDLPWVRNKLSAIGELAGGLVHSASTERNCMCCNRITHQ